MLGVFAIGFPSLYLPFGRDQGIHAFIAELAGDGFVVYRDVFNVKPPLTTVIHWLAQILFGETMRAIRIMDLVLVSATAAMLQKLVQRHLQSAWLGVVSAVAFAALHYSNDYWHTAQTDGWCNAFVVAAVLLYSHSLDTVSAPRRTLLLCSAGFCVGLSFWLKYTSAVVLMLFPVVHLLYRQPFRRIVFDAAAVATGFAACVAAVLLILYAQGALAQFIDIQNFFRSYVGISKPLSTLLFSPKYALEGAKIVAIVAALGAYACVAAILMRMRVVESWALLTWLFLGVVAALAQGKAFPYHLLALYPSIAVAAAVGAGVLVSPLRYHGKRRQEDFAILLLCCAFVGLSDVRRAYRDILPVAFKDEVTLRAFWEGDQFTEPDFSTADNLALVDYLKHETLPCDRVFIWGYESGVYFMSQRRPVSRFVYNFPMFTSYYRQSYRDEFMTALRANPPAVFIVQHADRTPRISGHNRDSAEVFATFEDLRAFVEDRYRPSGSVRRFDIY
ncbi:MAG: glycosyltransferase family 39 protein, partial [Burkholderiales bacterium]